MTDVAPGASSGGAAVPLALAQPEDRHTREEWEAAAAAVLFLLAPALLLLAVVGWVWLPGAPWFWTLLVAGVLGTPIFLQGAATVNRVVKAQRRRSAVGPSPEPPALWQGLRSPKFSSEWGRATSIGGWTSRT